MTITKFTLSEIIFIQFFKLNTAAGYKYCTGRNTVVKLAVEDTENEFLQQVGSSKESAGTYCFLGSNLASQSVKSTALLFQRREKYLQ